MCNRDFRLYPLVLYNLFSACHVWCMDCAWSSEEMWWTVIMMFVCCVNKQAIFMIPTKPPPSFRDPDKWSPQFSDFVSKCLVKNPEQRTSAKELLKVCCASVICLCAHFWFVIILAGLVLPCLYLFSFTILIVQFMLVMLCIPLSFVQDYSIPCMLLVLCKCRKT